MSTKLYAGWGFSSGNNKSMETTSKVGILRWLSATHKDVGRGASSTLEDRCQPCFRVTGLKPGPVIAVSDQFYPRGQ